MEKIKKIKRDSPNFTNKTRACLNKKFTIDAVSIRYENLFINYHSRIPVIDYYPIVR